LKVILTQGDTKHIFRSTLLWPDGSEVDLTGTTITFLLRSFDKEIAFEREVETPPSGSAVEYQPIDEDMAVTGLFWQRWKVVFPTTEGVQNFPNDSYNVIEILERLDL
jgi:hypothetical protein